MTIHRLYRFYFAFHSKYKGLPSSHEIMEAYDTANVVEVVVSRSLSESHDGNFVVSQLDEFLIQSYKDSTISNAEINDKREELF
ncbi:MAG TPA: hypothetical protein VF679_01415, partial [Pedobacter sp.]